ncbi:hypothetical protein [Tenacibaculum singaporense]|uniref:hypothetical protein n=1 Tax=Tenacibaculum singaporense TaxID=2358479 RepID=UPI003510DDF5
MKKLPFNSQVFRKLTKKEQKSINGGLSGYIGACHCVPYFQCATSLEDFVSLNPNIPVPSLSCNGILEVACCEFIIES